MKKCKNTVYIIILINIVFQIIYSTLGKNITSELGSLNYIFYVFRPEYLIVSGIIAFITLILHIILLIRSRKITKFDIIALVLNFEFMAYYIKLLSIQ